MAMNKRMSFIDRYKFNAKSAINKRTYIKYG